MSTVVGSNNLKKNNTSWAIFSIINNTKLNEKPVMGWRIVGGKKLTVNLYMRVIRKFRNEIVIRVADESDKSVFANIISGSDKLNLYLPEDLVLFQSKVKSSDENGDVTITFPDMIAQIDRRRHMRLSVPSELRVEMGFFKHSHGPRVSMQHFSKKCFDISAGGLSFVVSRLESKFFKAGDHVFGIELYIGEKMTRINGEVVNILELKPESHNDLIYKGYKICIRYIEPTQKQQDVINGFVFEHVDLEKAM